MAKDRAQEALAALAHSGGTLQETSQKRQQSPEETSEQEVQFLLNQQAAQQMAQRKDDPRELYENIQAYQNGTLDESAMNTVRERAKKLPFPTSFVNEILEHPLVGKLEEDTDSVKKQFIEKLSKGGGRGRSSLEIINRVDAMDNGGRIAPQTTYAQEQQPRNVINEAYKEKPTKSYESNTGIIDYKLLKEIIEEIIDDKLAEMNNELKGIKITEDGTFLVWGNADDIYECTMKYKGKKKKKK